MKKKYLIFIFMIFLLNIKPISAACTQEEIDAFKKIEDDYTVKYELDKSTREYILYFERSKPSLYEFVIHTNNSFECEEVSDKLVKCYYFTTGEYKITINGKTETCNDSLKTMTLKLPKYNELSEDPLCEGIEEFVLCTPTYDKEIDYDTFVSRVGTYKKSKASKTQEETESEKDEERNKALTNIGTFLKSYWIELIIVVVFVILVIITIIITIKAMRKSRYLE